MGSAALFLFSTQTASLQEVWKHPKQTAPATPDRLQAVPTDVLIGSGQVPASCAGSRGQQTWGRDGQPAHRREGSELPMLSSPDRDLGTEAEPFHNPPLSQGDLLQPCRQPHCTRPMHLQAYSASWSRIFKDPAMKKRRDHAEDLQVKHVF